MRQHRHEFASAWALRAFKLVTVDDYLEPTVFAALLRQHQAMVFSLAWRVCGRREVAEELAQEVFCQLLQSRPRLTSAQHLLFWLRQVTLRKAVDQVRRQRLRPRLGLEDVPEPATTDPEGDVLLFRRLRRWVEALPAEQRAAIVLRYQEEMEPAEMARLLQCSVHTVKSRLQRGLRALRVSASAVLEERV